MVFVPSAIKVTTWLTEFVNLSIFPTSNRLKLDAEHGTGKTKFALLAQLTGFVSTMSVCLSVISALLLTKILEIVSLAIKDITLSKENVSSLT